MMLRSMRLCLLLVVPLLLRSSLTEGSSSNFGIPLSKATTIASPRRSSLWGRETAVSNDASSVTLPREQQQVLSINRGGAVANTLANGFAGAAVMALIEKGVKEAFAANGIDFPAQLGGCIFLFAFLLLTEMFSPTMANSIFEALSPGSSLLAKWLPVFFVPGLILLPLSPPIGNASEIAKVLVVVTLGFLYSISTVTAVVVALRTMSGAIISAPASKQKSVPSAAKGPPPKPFSDETTSFFIKGTLLTGIVSLAVSRTNTLTGLEKPLQTLFLFFATFASYVWGARLPSAFVKVIHPLVTSAALLLMLVRFMAKVTGTGHLDILRSYKVGSLDFTKTGAGDILLYFLGPSVVSFAIAMYSRRSLLRSNLLVVLASMFMSAAGGLFGTAAFVRAIQLGGTNGSGNVVRLSVLARNVTTALALALVEMLGGDLPIGAFVVVATAIVGATYGKSLLSAFGVTDPISRGIGVGSSAQGLGVASLADEEDAFPFAAISMVLTAICATTLVSIPSVKESLIQLATGSAVAAAAETIA